MFLMIIIMFYKNYLNTGANVNIKKRLCKYSYISLSKRHIKQYLSIYYIWKIFVKLRNIFKLFYIFFKINCPMNITIITATHHRIKFPPKRMVVFVPTIAPKTLPTL